MVGFRVRQRRYLRSEGRSRMVGGNLVGTFNPRSRQKIYTGLMKSVTNKVPLVHRFTRSQQYSLVWNPFTEGGATGIGYHANNNITPATAGYFTFDSLPDYAEFTALFDSYKITGVKMTWTYSHNSSENSTGVNIPMLHWAHDHDDGSPVTSINSLMQYSTYKTRRLDKPVTVFVRPKIAQMAYQGAVGTGYTTPNRNPWIDCGDPDVQHFGIKWALEAMGDAENTARGVIRLTCKFYFQTKATI